MQYYYGRGVPRVQLSSSRHSATQYYFGGRCWWFGRRLL